MNMKRLTEMVMGALEAARWPAGACAARDLAAAAAREGMDRVFPPTSAENVNVRAMLAVGLQGLMRGRNSGARVRLTRRATSRAGSGRMHGAEARDVRSSGEGHAPPSGQGGPLVMGGGASLIDACEVVRRMLLLDSTPAGEDALTPMFGGRRRGVPC